MRDHAHDEEPLTAQRSVRTGQSESMRPSAGGMLNLQRSAGNSAVTQAVRTGRLSDVGIASGGMAVQRAAAEEEGAATESDESGAAPAGTGEEESVGEESDEG